MNQNDYKEISGIIKRNYPDVYDNEARLAIDKLTLVSRELADYFNKKEISHCFENRKDWRDMRFHKEQFLKDCGVYLFWGQQQFLKDLAERKNEPKRT